MAISDAVQTLSAAFSFGILLQASSGTLFLYYRGHGSTIFQDGRRLVLLLFLLIAALWAQIGFLNLLLPSSSITACQATLAFSTMFDQLARVAIEQFLLWSVGHGTKLTAERLVLQVILLFRLVAGGLFVGFTRPDFAPTCVARTSIFPIAILVLVLDVIIVGVLTIRALSLGMFGELRKKDSSPRQEQSRALIITIAGFAVWTGISVAMILGIPTILLILRTVLPSNGLLILVGIVTIFLGPLMLAGEEEAITPEARSPFVTPMPPSRELFQENFASNGSPILGHGYTKSGGLFVVNPSATPRDSPTTMYQRDSRGNIKRFTKLGEEGKAGFTSIDAPGRPNRPEGKYGPGYRGSSGVFPSMLTASQLSDTGALAPKIRPNITLKTQDSSTVTQQKRSLFDWSKPTAKISVRSLAISQPVMASADGSAVEPLARMATIDLATAAVNERKRREDAAARSRLVSNRAPPQSPGLSTNEGLRRSISVKRKDTPSHTTKAMPTMPAFSTSELSVDAANGSSTSAFLSPGREEIRRRSPRNANNFDTLIDEKPTQLPFQKKGTIGLPSNPRSQRITMAQEIGMQREQTVMFMNDIIYNDPGMVRTIIGEAPGMSASARKINKTSGKSSTDSTGNLLHSANSIIHRPRPYKRDIEKQRAFFPSEQSPGHKRSRSGSSVVVRKSFFTSNPGSPTFLPPLPPPPTSASRLTRLLPNDTKSMTLNEKIQLLFPAPPGGISTHKRRSSVPSLPRVPPAFNSESPQAQSPTIEDQQSQRVSKRTTIASFGVPDITSLDLSPRFEVSRQGERQAYRFSANTYRTIADQVGESWIPGILPEEFDIRNLIQQSPAPGPSIYDMRQSHFTEATTSDESSQDDPTTYSGSITSRVLPVDLSKAVPNEEATIIRGSSARAEVAAGAGLPIVPEVKHSKEEEMMTVIFDSEETAMTFLSEPSHDGGSFFLDADQTLPGDKTPTARNLPLWHRRIGDELPTFSERKSNVRSRKMPPPTPLLLNKSGRRANIIVQAAEPSPPADSPERAIQEIQTQLKRFEEASRGSVGSLLRHLPDAASTGVDEQDSNGRLRLLENLEKEMGEQQDQWKQMQVNLDRDSISVGLSPQVEIPLEEEMSRQSSQRSVRTPTRVLSRRARIRSSMAVQSKGEDSTRTNSTASSDNSRASIWQQRLAEAQIAYVENAPNLLLNRSLNFLSISKAQHQQLGSPTPPDSETELETDFESDSENGDAIEKITEALPSLWQPLPHSPKAATGPMWNPPSETSNSRPASPHLPAQNIRPVQRRLDHPLPIFSFYLWSKPNSSNQSCPAVGLWASRPVRPRSTVTRRATQRPQRKSRRVTFLPDIVESPVPVPNKRDTLGIFQFPWGETSDQPVYQPAFNPVLLTGPAINVEFDIRSRQLEPELEYESSFFDDYDDGDADQESDDDFDESTLWEIANLLKSNNVPSKNSLLPCGRPEIIEDYDESESDLEQTSIDKSGQAAPTIHVPIQPLSISSKDNSQLWSNDVTSSFSSVVAGLPEPEPSVWKVLVPSDDVIRSKPRNSNTLPVIATSDLWTLSEPNMNDGTSSIWTNKENLEKSSSTATTSRVKMPEPLWSPSAIRTEDCSSGLFSASTEGSSIVTTQAEPAVIKMEEPPRQESDTVANILAQNTWTPIQNLQNTTEWISKSIAFRNRHVVACSFSLWTPPARMATINVSGLFSISSSRPDYRTSHLPPAGINMAYNPQKCLRPLSKLTSSKLWNGCKQLPIEHHWISESSVRPESPSAYSTTPSGSSSPASDSSSAKSTSTKASSTWGFVGTAAPTPASAWWEGKNTEKSAPNSPEDESKHTSRIPVCQASLKHLTPLRESRVLASHDIWASRARVLDTPAKKFPEGVAAEREAPPTVKPLRRQYRSTVTFSVDSDRAVAETALAATPKKSLTRFFASTADWESALIEAVTLGHATKHSKLEPSVMHPVFFTDFLVSSTVEVHPAATGYVTKSQHYDASVLHPVFFTECLSSDVSEVHPAALGHLAYKQANSGMWTISSLPTGFKRTQLWSKNTSKARDTSVHFVEHSSQAVRKALPIKPLELPVLKSNSLWQPLRDPQEHCHWLPKPIGSAQFASPQTWVSRTHTLQNNVSGSMRTIPAAANSPSAPDVFVHKRGGQAKQSPRQLALQRLDINALSAKDNTESPTTHWLHKTSAAGLAFKQPITWTAPPSKQSAKKGNIWNARAAFDPTSVSLFSNPHTQPWNRNKREDASLKKIESTGMWRLSYCLPQSQRNWLLDRRVSKVEFRY